MTAIGTGLWTPHRPVSFQRAAGSLRLSARLKRVARTANWRLLASIGGCALTWTAVGALIAHL